MKKFILGMLFTLLALPLIDDIVTILANKTQLYSYQIAKKINDIKKQIDDNMNLQEENNPIGFSTSCVGFEIDNPEIEEEE